MVKTGDKVKKEYFTRGDLPGCGRFLEQDHYYGKVVHIENDSYAVVKWRHLRALETERIADLIDVSDEEWKRISR
jgi:hypothetical protein